MTAGAKGSGITELKKGIYQLRGKCMVYLLRGARKNLLIDTGLTSDISMLESQLKELGLSPDDIHLIILTHEHVDHIGGVPLFSGRTVVAAHSLAANKIVLQDEFVLMTKAFGRSADAFHVDIHLHHGTTVDLGGYVLQVIHTPGHCSGAICLYESEHQLLFTGDTMFAGGTLGGIFPSGSISDYALTLKHLSHLKVQEIYPGHGRISKTPSEDFDKAIKASIHLMNDTKALFDALNSQDEFMQIMRAVSTYSKRV